MSIKDQIDTSKLPQHIAIIMDGNGRWAKKRLQPRVFGHRSALKAVRNTIEGCAELGVKYLTLYAFSTENWNRPQLEVKALMELLVRAIKDEVKTLNKNNIRLQAIGDLSSLPQKAQNELEQAIKDTASNTKMTVILSLSYSAKWEILEAVNTMIKDAKAGELTTSVTDEIFSSYLTTADFPDPDLMIRTSGEYRISNFLLWQLAYAELYFTDTLWPDFHKEELYKAIIDFQNRERRYGLTGEQISIKK